MSERIKTGFMIGSALVITLLNLLIVILAI